MRRSCDTYENCEKVETDEDILNIVEIFVRVVFSDIPERRYNWSFVRLKTHYALSFHLFCRLCC